MIKGVVFDMDGVVSDTQKLHSKVESELLARYGVDLSPELITKKYAGVRTKDFFKDYLDTQDRPYDLDAIIEEKWGLLVKEANKEVEIMPGIYELLALLKNLNISLTIGSSSTREYVKAVLQKMNIQDKFLFLATGDIVEKGKPDPETFLLAASKMNLEPKTCLVIEDGISGMNAAIVGGFKCIGIVKDKTKQYPTKNLVTSLEEIDEEYLNNLS